MIYTSVEVGLGPASRPAIDETGFVLSVEISMYLSVYILQVNLALRASDYNWMKWGGVVVSADPTAEQG